jgi:signal peptide peptidase SppA
MADEDLEDGVVETPRLGMAPLAYARLLSEPWAVTEAFAEIALDIVCRRGEGPEALSARLGRPLDNTRKVEVRDGVAVLPVQGPIFRHANLMTEHSGATSLGQLTTDFNVALDDPAVRGIVLDVDSPGGQATGVGELADMIRAGADRKPVVAYVGGQGASGGYWLAAAASKIVAHQTASLGSIGAVLRVVDASPRKGEHRFVSSVSPHKRPDLTTDDGRAPIQTEIDDLGRHFLESVAAFRGVSADHALEHFGKGATFSGPRALAAGMVDELGSLEGVIADLQSSFQAGGMVPRAASARGTLMANQPGPAATPDLATVTLDQLRAENPRLVESIAGDAKASALEQARRETAEAVAQARAEATAAERARVAAVTAHPEAAGREKAALSLALKSGMDAEAAGAVLADLPKIAAPAPQKVEVVAAATDFAAHMARQGNPQVGADLAADDEVGALVLRARAREGRAN